MAWARLFVVGFVGAVFRHFGEHLPGQLAGGMRRQLGLVAGTVAELIFVHAAARVVLPPHRARHRHGRLKAAGKQRAVIGSSLRGALRGKTLPARIAAIVSVMRDCEHHIAKLARRLARGLTRLRVIVPAPQPGPRIAAPPLPAAPCADTS